MAFTKQHIAALGKLQKRIRDAGPSTRSRAKAAERLGRFLLKSEANLKAYLDDAPSVRRPGNVEFGLVLYLIQHEIIPKELKPLHRWLRRHLPRSTIAKRDMRRIEKDLLDSGIVAGDGSLIGFGKYEQLDPGWLVSFVFFVLTYLGITKDATFGTKPFHGTLDPNGPVTLALIGDWGTGKWKDGKDRQGPAIDIMDQVKRLAPDYTIHLGDVYYAGTRSTGEERRNFAKVWAEGTKGSFALNSNHEMYAGGRGYFQVALRQKMFAHQNRTSYFALEYGDWLILGLDTAYYAPRSSLFMNGRLKDRHQKDFIASLNVADKNVVVMTHHDGLNLTGSRRLRLWRDVQSALGKDPDYWYWGHVHNGIVYTERSKAGLLTKARCVGHGAIPFGAARNLKNAGANVAYYAHTPYGDYRKPSKRQKNRVLNGFALLTLNGDALTEAFYEQGNDAPVWTSSG